jgi:dienelactone hydrolase
MISRRQFFALGAFASIAAACSSDSTTTASTAPTSDAASTTAVTTIAPATTTASTVAPTTTISAAELALTYTEAGPYPVGVTTLTLAKGNKVEIWYPAVAGTTGEVAYDVRDFTPPAIKAILTADIPASYTFAGGRDAASAEGTFPVVLFSHGYTGIRLQSSFLTSHLASWGMIVAAPDHPSRDLPGVLGGTASGDRNDSVDDLLKTLDLVLAEGASTTSLIAGRVDTAKVVALGHSAGGGTIVGAAADPRVSGYVSMASGIMLGGGNATDTSVGATTVPPTPVPDKPSFFLAGSADEVVPAATVTQPSFEQAPTPTRLWIIDKVGHNGFDDFCTFGNGQGIIGVAEASGLGGLLEAQPQLKKLGQDGCVPPAVPVTETFPIILHAVTSWMRNHFGVDAEPVGLGAEVADQYNVAITISERL